MGYARVLPRDLFNEAKLLKCVGFLSLKIHNYSLEPLIKLLHITEENSGFDIVQNEDGDLEIQNLMLFIVQKRVRLYTPLNSRENMPLYAEYEDEVYQVFERYKSHRPFHEDFYDLCRLLGVELT